MPTEMWRAMTGHEQVTGRLAGGFGCGIASQTSSATILEQTVVSNQFSPIPTQDQGWRERLNESAPH